MIWGAIIVAAGRGTRLNRPKQLLDVAGMPLAGWCMRTFAQIHEISDVIVVTEPDMLEEMNALAARIFSGEKAADMTIVRVDAKTFRVVTGGATRQESVKRGLDALPGRCDAVLVHDGARPLVSARDVRAGMAEVRPGRASLLAAPCVDTVKIVDAATMTVVQTPDRTTLWAAQTPQFATVSDLRRAHEQAAANNIVATDDTALLERIGVEVAIVPATSANFKVTRPEDLALAATFLQQHLETSGNRQSG
jgi:2-C-methyl-D-erythritol 4-phosphate cytidylyltransferase